jgi:hypothetical protein
MSNQFLKLRRSAVPGKIPETSSLDLGELAINTFDGQLFLKKSGSQGSIVTVVGSTGSFTGSFFGNGAGLINIPASGITGLNLSRIATGSVTASVNTDISASFRITSGSNTLLNVTRDGRTWIGAGTFADAAYQLDVNGTARVNGTLNVTSSLILENNTILFDVVTGPPTGPLRIVRRTGWGVNAGIEIGALNTNISTFTAVPTIIGGGNTYSDNRQAIIGQNNAISGIGVVLGNDNTVTNSGNINVIIGTGNVQNVSNFNNFAHILVGQGNNTNGFAGGGLFGSAIKYYAAGQLAFGANSSFTNNSISDVYFGNGVRNENNTSVSNNGNGPSISINPSWASDAADKNGGNITIAGGRGTGTGSAGDVLFATATQLITGTTLQSLTNRWWVKGGTGTLTNKGTSSLAVLDISGSSIFTGSIGLQGSITASAALITGTLTAQTLVVQTITSSILYSSGSNIFGNRLTDTQQFTGSVLITGSTVSLTGGSFSGSGANLFNIPASGITGLNLSRIATGSISASVNTDISSSFRLTSGSNTLLNVTREGFVWIGNGTFTNQAYQLDVQGTARVNGILTIGATGASFDIAYVTGGFGNINLGGSIGATPDRTIAVGGVASGLLSTAVGMSTNASGGGTAIGGYQTVATGGIAISSGVGAAIASGTQATAVGNGAAVYTAGSAAAINGVVGASGNNSNGVALGGTVIGGVLNGAVAIYGYAGANQSVAIYGSTSAAGEFVVGSAYDNGDMSNFAMTNVYFGSGKQRANTGGSNKTGSGISYTINGSGAFGSDFAGGNITIAGGKGTGTGSAGDVILATSTPTTTGTTLQSLTNRWWVKGTSGTLSNVSNPPSASLYVSGSFIVNGAQFNNTSSVTVAGVTTVSQLSTSSYTSCFYNYTVASASNARSGQVMTVWNGNSLRYIEVVTTDIGDTNLVAVSASLSSGFVRLQVSASSGWTFKNISNLL